MKLRYILAGAAVLALGGGITLAQVPGAVVLTTLTGTEYIQNFNATLSQVFSTSTLTSYIRSSGLLYTSVATASSPATTTASQVIGSYTLPASTLATGDKLRIKASWSLASDTNTKTVGCYFGSEAISSGALTTNGKNASCEMIVTEIGTSKQIVYGNMLVDTTPITGYVSISAAETSTATIPITVKSTSSTTVAGQIVLNDFSVELLGP